MQQPHSRNDPPSERLSRRLDRLFREINAFLLVLAIGLAVLDLTCFMTLQLSSALRQPFTTESD